MKKILMVLVLVLLTSTFMGCTGDKNNNNNGNNIENNNSINNKEEIKVDVKDFVTGEALNFENELTGIGMSGDTKTFKLNETIGEKEITGFEGTVKSAKYIHDENLEKLGTLALLNTEGKAYISNGGLFTDKVYMSEVRLEEKVKAISTTSSYRNKRGVVLLLTESNKIKAIDDESKEVYEISEQEERKFSNLYENIVENGKMWRPVFTINPATQEKIYFKEPVSTYMFNDEESMSYEDNKTNENKYGKYVINQETGNVEITYNDGGEKELLIYVDDLGDGEIYLKITQPDGLERYYRQ